MENILFEHKKIELGIKGHFVETKQIMQHFLKMQYISLLS
jgi:hypothetical protein